MKRSINRRDFLINSAVIGVSLRHSSMLNAAQTVADGRSGAALEAVSYSHIKLTNSFWANKQATIATSSVHHLIKQVETTGVLRNFEKAARRAAEPHEGIFFTDSDIYKTLETIAYCLSYRPDTEFENTADSWIDKISAAQLPDGYLNTYFTLTGIHNRWTDMDFHEDYCAGHLIEAAVAYYQVTGKRKLLDVAIKFADHIDSTLRAENRHWISGHEEIELALVKLFHLTNSDKYLKLANWYIDQRGRGYDNSASWQGEVDHEYNQDDIPVRQQRKIKGHAVRAMYLYSAVADLAPLTHDPDYLFTLKAIWDDTVHRNMYVTGGIGSTRQNEGFSHDYDLPNVDAYCETCASVGMVLWNHRMNLLTGESQYVDILERSLYNGALAGISLSGDRFFYTNPLASSASFPTSFGLGRQKYANGFCCPPNITRLIASLGGYVYGISARTIWVNLFVASEAQMIVGNRRIAVRMDTDYPWSGDIRLTMNPERQERYALRLRVPGWARNVAAPGDLYQFTDANKNEFVLRINGRPAHYSEENGYLIVDRRWAPGDIVEFLLPMPIRTVVARREVGADRDRIMLQRGPLVYCAEAVDNGGNAWNLVVDDRTQLAEAVDRIHDERIIALRGNVDAVKPTGDGRDARTQAVTLTAIPYYAWANRECYDMQVWLPTRIDGLRIDA